MHIKAVNTEGKYQCIIVGHNNPVRVDMRKGYEVVYWLSFFMSAFHVDSIYPGLNYGGPKEPPLLAFRLILIVKQAAQYIVYGESGF